MNTANCPRCGTRLAADAPAGLCPRCLLQGGLASEPVEVRETTPSPGPTGFVPPSVAELQRSFPQLEILDLLGQGGMGAVYKARQPGLDRFVALKILPPQVGRDPHFAERFAREARALAKLSHPNIVAVHDSGNAGGLYYFLMEFVEGANLRQTIASGALRPVEALAVVPQICDALQYAHDEGVVHRDIKPENILLDKKGRVKIADFGLSKLLGDDRLDVSLTGTHQIMGTLRYMAPEQMKGTRTVDHRADIYSLGVVFYELLTGDVPMGRFDPPSQRVQVDVRLDEVVLRTLAQEPDKRYQRASEVKTDLEAMAKSPVHSPVVATKARDVWPETPGATRPASSNSWIVVVVVVLLVVTCLPAVVLLGFIGLGALSFVTLRSSDSGSMNESSPMPYVTHSDSMTQGGTRRATPQRGQFEYWAGAYLQHLKDGQWQHAVEGMTADSLTGYIGDRERKAEVLKAEVENAPWYAAFRAADGEAINRAINQGGIAQSDPTANVRFQVVLPARQETGDPVISMTLEFVPEGNEWKVVKVKGEVTSQSPALPTPEVEPKKEDAP